MNSMKKYYLVEWYDGDELVDADVVSHFHLMRLLRAEHMEESDFALWESHYNEGEPMTLRSDDGYFMTIKRLEK